MLHTMQPTVVLATATVLVLVPDGPVPAKWFLRVNLPVRAILIKTVLSSKKAWEKKRDAAEDGIGVFRVQLPPTIMSSPPFQPPFLLMGVVQPTQTVLVLLKNQRQAAAPALASVWDLLLDGLAQAKCSQKGNLLGHVRQTVTVPSG